MHGLASTYEAPVLHTKLQALAENVQIPSTQDWNWWRLILHIFSSDIHGNIAGSTLPSEVQQPDVQVASLWRTQLWCLILWGDVPSPCSVGLNCLEIYLQDSWGDPCCCTLSVSSFESVYLWRLSSFYVVWSEKVFDLVSISVLEHLQILPPLKRFTPMLETVMVFQFTSHQFHDCALYYYRLLGAPANLLSCEFLLSSIRHL